MIKSFIEDEAQGIGLKFCLSMVCVSILVFSLFQLGNAFQLWVSQYKDAFQMSCVLFSSTILLSLVGIFLLFSKSKPEVKDTGMVDMRHPLIGMNLQEKGFTFVRGLIDGLVSGRRPY